MQMIDALIFLKEKKVVHRDLKPTNVLFLADQDGVLKLVKIIDFGVAISLDPKYETDLFEGKTVGTLNFMAPEQLVGKESYGSDLYSLGAIIYTLLAGRVPLVLEGVANLKEKLRLVYRGARTPILEANPDLLTFSELTELAGVVEEMLILDPQKRPSIEMVKEKMEQLWSQIDDTEKMVWPIRYAKEWVGLGPDAWARTTTDTLVVDDLTS